MLSFVESERAVPELTFARGLYVWVVQPLACKMQRRRHPRERSGFSEPWPPQSLRPGPQGLVGMLSRALCSGLQLIGERALSDPAQWRSVWSLSWALNSCQPGLGWWERSSVERLVMTTLIAH